MKKLVALLLVLSLVACLFVGCSKDDKASDTPADDQNTEEAPETDQPEENTEVDQPEENTETTSGLHHRHRQHRRPLLQPVLL